MFNPGRSFLFRIVCGPITILPTWPPAQELTVTLILSQSIGTIFDEKAYLILFKTTGFSMGISLKFVNISYLFKGNSISTKHIGAISKLLN